MNLTHFVLSVGTPYVLIVYLLPAVVAVIVAMVLAADIEDGWVSVVAILVSLTYVFWAWYGGAWYGGVWANILWTAGMVVGQFFAIAILSIAVFMPEHPTYDIWGHDEEEDYAYS